MKELLSHPEAAAELEAAADYFEGRRAGYGELFRGEVEVLFHRAEESPAAIPLYSKYGCRRARLKTFPHWLYFLELDEVVWFVALAHPSQERDTWLHRLDDIAAQQPPTPPHEV